MKKVVFVIILFFIVCMSCKKKSTLPLELEILNDELKVNRDDLKIQLTNNSNNDYLLYFDRNKLIFQDSPQALSLNIVSKDDNPVRTVFSTSDPIWILDEETGNISYEDSISQRKYFDCIDKDTYVILKAKKKLRIDIPFIDSTDECGRKNYPILEKKLFYKTSLKLNLDSTLIPKSEMDKINRVRKDKKVKLFQGQINSNSIILKS